MKLTDIIPWYYRWLAIILLLASCGLWCFVSGMKHTQKKWDAATEKENNLVLQKRVKQAEVTQQVITKYVDRIKVVKEKGDTIIKEIPNYVSVKSDSQCIINNGFIKLHDSAAKNSLPDSPGGIDDSPSTLKLSTAIETIISNYNIANSNAERLKSLQEWVVEQKKLN